MLNILRANGRCIDQCYPINQIAAPIPRNAIQRQKTDPKPEAVDVAGLFFFIICFWGAALTSSFKSVDGQLDSENFSAFATLLLLMKLIASGMIIFRGFPRTSILVLFVCVLCELGVALWPSLQLSDVSILKTGDIAMQLISLSAWGFCVLNSAQSAKSNILMLLLEEAEDIEKKQKSWRYNYPQRNLGRSGTTL
ncbi:hypothetical protein AB4072_09030 [Microvirga sp. 2MCAF38]|uniref:hypothetical protein n=1 Tax=Microvirga sp. 2MCAF38 TaxID=3232989 RepID=UPI003F9E83F4